MSIDTRCRSLVAKQSPDRGRFTLLESETGISIISWRNWWYGKQSISAQQVEGLSTLWPEYAFWVATGLADHVAGHLGIQDAAIDSECMPLTPFSSAITWRSLIKAGANQPSAVDTAKIQHLSRMREIEMYQLLRQKFNGSETSMVASDRLISNHI